MKSKIKNRLVWVLVTRGEQELLAIADRRHCDECKSHTWAVYMTLDRDHAHTKAHCCMSTRVPKQKCPICNPSRPLTVGAICLACYDALIDHTKALYKTCLYTSGPCSCKYCRTLGRV